MKMQINKLICCDRNILIRELNRFNGGGWKFEWELQMLKLFPIWSKV